MEQPQSQRRRVIASLNSPLDAEEFDSMVMHLLTPSSECGDVLRTSDGWAGGLKGNWLESKVGALRDDADAQGGAQVAPNDAAPRACGRRKRKPSQKAAEGRSAATAVTAALDAETGALVPGFSSATAAQLSAEVVPLPNLSVPELLAQVIGPAAAAYVGRVHVSDMVIAARLEPRAPLANFSVPGQTAILQAATGLCAMVTRHAAELREACETLREAGESDAPAWLLGKRAPPHAEAALHALQLHVHALTATLEDALSPTRGYVAVLQRPLSAPERGHISDNTFSLGELHKFLSSAQSMLAEMRCKRGGAAVYLETSAAILDLIALITSVTADNHKKRISEFGPRAAKSLVWPTPFFEHAKAVGCSL